MEELTNTESFTEDTTPEVNEQTTEAETNETDADTTQTETEADAETDGNEDVADNDNSGQVAEPPKFSVKFNHKTFELTQEEAAERVQLQMKHEPLMQKLTAAAEIVGQTPAKVIDDLLNIFNKSEYDKLVEKFGGDEELAQEAFEVVKSKNKKAFDKLIEEEQNASKSDFDNRNKRIADQFPDLQKEFSEVKRIEDIPKPVLESAANGSNLNEAYALYKLRQEKKIADAKEKEAEAKKSTTGSQADVSNSVSDPLIDAMLSGLRVK